MMLQRYPYTSLQDVYKSCFQDFFGPAHAIPSYDKAMAYIAQELAQAEMTDTLYYEPCGMRGNYYRVSLAVVADSIVSLNAFADAFYRSAPAVTPQVTDVWINEWQCIQQVVQAVVKENAHRISRHAPLITDFQEDSTAIADMLQQGKYVVHHSKLYNELYNPHYRIIRRDIFENEILPLLRERGL
ncbi:MAG: hypothetical protein J6J06_02405 [Bacteroidaceae bacterium]|nr:hypothetical protein [Bacteroidaceae bacterium]